MKWIKNSVALILLAANGALAPNAKGAMVPPEMKKILKYIISNDERGLKSEIAESRLNLSNSKYQNIIFYATTLPILEILSNSGMSYTVTDNSGMDMLIVAAQAGSYDIVEFLLKQGWNVNSKNYEGKSALYFSCGDLDARITRLLLKQGAYVDIQTSQGVTPCMEAIESGNVDALRALLEYRPNLLLRNSSGQTVYFYLQTDSFHVDSGIRKQMTAIIDAACQKAAVKIGTMSSPTKILKP